MPISNICWRQHDWVAEDLWLGEQHGINQVSVGSQEVAEQCTVDGIYFANIYLPILGDFFGIFN